MDETRPQVAATSPQDSAFELVQAGIRTASPTVTIRQRASACKWPISTVGECLWLDNRKAHRDVVLTTLGHRYGLFHFYAQICGACKVFAPILRSITDSCRMWVMAVSMDGGPSKDFPNYIVGSGQRSKMGVPGNETPTKVPFNTQTKRTI